MVKGFVSLSVAVSLTVLLFNGGAAWGQPTTAAKPDKSYLMLISFANKSIPEFDEAKTQIINESAYDGVALTLRPSSCYNVDSPPSFDAYQAQMQALSKTCRKHIWPWVFDNRLNGVIASARSKLAQKDYFKRIKGCDLWDEQGARTDFLKLWRHALRLARTFGAPGVLLDQECYNDQKLYNVRYLAKQSGRNVPETVAALRLLGRDMADIVAEEYPKAVIWTLFSGLDRPNGDTKIGLINSSLLDRAVENKIPLTFVCGGETGLNYVNPSPEVLRANMLNRLVTARPRMKRYQGRFVLGGTIAPWTNVEQITGWAKHRAGKNPRFQNLNDFAPMFDLLLRGHPYVWVYAASAARFNPYDVDTHRISTPILKGFRASAADAGPLNLAGVLDQIADAPKERKAIPDAEPYQEFEKWQVSGGPEASLRRTDKPSHAGKFSLAFTVKVNWKNGDPKYKRGWLGLNRRFDAPQDWSGYDAIQFWLYIPADHPSSTEKTLRFALKTDTPPLRWIDLPFTRGGWQRVRIPLEMLASPADMAQVAGLKFYVAEAWYLDGDNLVFNFDEFELLKLKGR